MVLLLKESKMRRCELCKSMATIYCDSDRASLCWTCDAKVHSANFLVARHSRSLLCDLCHSRTPWTASGRKLWPSTASSCGRCSSKQEDDDLEEEGVRGNTNGISCDDAIDNNMGRLVPPPPASCSTQHFFPKRKRHNSHEDEIEIEIEIDLDLETDSSSVNINNHPSSTRLIGHETGSSYHSTVSSSNTGSVDNTKKVGDDRNAISGEYMQESVVPRGKSRKTLELDLNVSAVE